MSGSGFTLTCQRKRKKAPTEEECEELYQGIQELITSFFEENLTNDAEAAMWEDIAACADTLAELRADELEMGRVSFVFHDFWRGGAEAAEHWYRLALASEATALCKLLAGAGFSITPKEIEALRDGDHTKPLAEVQGKIFAIEDGGVPIVAEGEALTLSDDERAQLHAIALSGSCQCQLCAS
jgi:hypothetical protein